MSPVLEVRNLSINFNTFEGKARVVDEVSLKMEKGEAVSLVGETGCGKSVTAKAIMGILPIPPGEIASGEIFLNGENIFKMNEKRRMKIRGRQISMMFQDPMSALNPVFTIGDQIKNVLKFQGKANIVVIKRLLGRVRKRGDEEKIIDILAKVGLPSPREILRKYPFELSGGMRQRCLIAMALINNPDVVIVDEPCTALDVTIQKQILDLMIDKIAKMGISILYITHNLGVARIISQKVYVMYAGKIMEVAPTVDLFNKPLHPYTKGLLKCVPKLVGEMDEGIMGRIPNYYHPPSGCRFHPRCSYSTTLCKKEKPDLIEVEKNHWVRCHLWQ